MALMRRGEHLAMTWPEWFPRWWLRFSEELSEAFEAEPILRVEEEMQDDVLIIRAEMPGIEPEKDVEITMSDAGLHIRAERRQETKTETRGRVRTEFRYGAFSRTLPLPAGAKVEDVQASYKDGILEIRVPFDTAKAAASRIPIKHD